MPLIHKKIQPNFVKKQNESKFLKTIYGFDYLFQPCTEIQCLFINLNQIPTIENLQKNMTLTFFNFKVTRGYIYKVMKKKVGFYDGGLGY